MRKGPKAKVKSWVSSRSIKGPVSLLNVISRVQNSFRKAPSPPFINDRLRSHPDDGGKDQGHQTGKHLHRRMAGQNQQAVQPYRDREVQQGQKQNRQRAGIFETQLHAANGKIGVLEEKHTGGQKHIKNRAQAPSPLSVFSPGRGPDRSGPLHGGGKKLPDVIAPLLTRLGAAAVQLQPVALFPGFLLQGHAGLEQGRLRLLPA